MEEDDHDVPQEPPTKRTRRSPDAEGSSSGAEEETEEFGGWGTSKRDYYDADPVETEADAREQEAEARRLQQKRLQSMAEADFAFDETEWREVHGKVDGDGEEAGPGRTVTEVLPELKITDAMGTDERLKILKTRYPEFEPLAKEFLDLQPLHDDLRLLATSSTTISRDPKPAHNGHRQAQSHIQSVPTIKYQALAAYLGALTMYFALLTSTSKDSQGTAPAMAVTELREHSVMDSLVKCRSVWSRVKDLHLPDSSVQIEQSNDDPAIIEEEDRRPVANGHVTSQERPQLAVKLAKPSKKQVAAKAAQEEAEARRIKRMLETEEELASLSALLKPSKSRAGDPKRRATASDPTQDEDNEDGSDLGEETQLAPHEAAEKARRKKSLRFYTSQIAQKSNKREQAGKDAGGDADLPYRERLKDRQAGLNAEAEKRGKKVQRDEDQTDALGGEGDEGNRRLAGQLRGEEGSDEDGYYDMVAASLQQRKADKKARHESQARAARAGGDQATFTDSKVGPDGKRAIGYTIEKNKGLAPKRKKEVRNPRVKKRRKFDEKKKKLGSVRPVYRGGGEGRGGYAGETTGIKPGLVKSVKL